MNSRHSIIWASWLGTAIFVVSAAIATASAGFGETYRVICLVLFAVGCVAFLSAFFRGVDRSRESEIAVSNLYFLAGSAPTAVRLQLFGSLGVQVVVGFLTASLRPYTLVAFGILVPMYGLGMTGLWGAEHGVFPDRFPSDAATTETPPSETTDAPGDQAL